MVGQDDQVPRAEVGADASRGRGKDERVDAQPLEHADRERHRLQVVSLVVVESSLEHQYPGTC